MDQTLHFLPAFLGIFRQRIEYHLPIGENTAIAANDSLYSILYQLFVSVLDGGKNVTSSGIFVKKNQPADPFHFLHLRFWNIIDKNRLKVNRKFLSMVNYQR